MNKKYLYQDLTQSEQEKVFNDISVSVAVEGDDLLEAQERTNKHIEKYNHPKTKKEWNTNLY